MPKSPFTESDIKAVGRAAHEVWREIAFDIFTASADMWNHEHPKGKRKTADDIIIPRSQVIELVLDANRMDDKLRHNLGKERGEELIRLISVAENRHVMTMMKGIFPYTKYGT